MTTITFENIREVLSEIFPGLEIGEITAEGGGVIYIRIINNEIKLDEKVPFHTDPKELIKPIKKRLVYNLKAMIEYEKLRLEYLQSKLKDLASVN